MTIAVPSLLQALDAGLRNKVDDWDDSRLHISDLAVAIEEKCPRQLWLRMGGAKRKKDTTGKLLMFDHGHRIHERLVELMQLNNGWEIQVVEKAVDLGNVTGRYDARLWNKNEGWEIIVDFKSLRGKAFGFLQDVRPSHRLQVQCYIAAADADGGIVFYVDREGQNAAKQFYVQRDDAEVWQAVKAAKEIIAGPMPDRQKPKLNIRKNKGPDSVYLEMPWFCDYCDYCGASCPGALPKKLRNLGIIGKIDKANGGKFVPAKDIPGEAVEIAEALLDESAIPF